MQISKRQQRWIPLWLALVEPAYLPDAWDRCEEWLGFCGVEGHDFDDIDRLLMDFETMGA